MNRWNAGKADMNVIQSFVSGCQVAPLTAMVLSSKGFTSTEDVVKKFNVSGLSDPFEIKDMDKAVEIINSAIDNGEKICVYGDYDCDGITATVIMYSYLLQAGADVMYYIPERHEGYGLNNSAIDRIHESGAEIILTVDNGIMALAESEYIYSLGMRLVITDHHEQGENLPRAEAIVDPHRHDCTSSFKYMCGAGLALKLVAGLEGGDYTLALEQFADLASIATVADVVSLTGENRFLVSYGLKLVNNTDRPALMALKEVAQIKGSLDATGVGFKIAPRINASGRCASPELAVKLLLSENYDVAVELAEKLDALNEERRRIENNIINDINKIIDENPDVIRGRIIFICGKDWHHGVIGIVASRIEERYGKPCFIASENDGEIRGSARSFGNFSVHSALMYASDVLEKFGGHTGAGGFTIKAGMKNKFNALLEKYALENHKFMPVFTVHADVVLPLEMITLQNVENLSVLEPCGCDNEKPRFIIVNAFINEVTALSNGKHSKLKISAGGNDFNVLIFSVSPHELTVRAGEYCDMVAYLSVNEFNGRKSIDLFADDIRPSKFSQNKYFTGKSIFEAFLRGEELQQNYYAGMLPTREETARIYGGISAGGDVLDKLYMKFCQEINYCKFSVAVEAMRQLGIVEVSFSDSFIKRAEITKKADLNSAPVLVALKEKIN